MTTDIARLIGVVKREVSSRERDGSMARVLSATRPYDAARRELWDDLTIANRIASWFLPISGELRRGGSYQLEGNAEGEIVRCDPRSRFDLTWKIHGQVSWVTVQLSGNARGPTLLRLEHVAHIPDALWNEYGPGAVGVGWEHALLGLDQHCAAPELRLPQKATDWLSSDEGKSFSRLSSDAWGTASIDAGTDPMAARAASARAAAFYTGGG